MQSLSLRRAVPFALLSSLALVACGDDDTVARDGGADTSISTDTGSPDTSRPDASPPPPPPDAGEDAGDAAGDATPPEDAMPPVDAEVDSGLPDA
ncbi:MAG: hypothetical protein IT379_40525, partial [Deltaproteobacteria bacterium]|nr:hypothetical protein [Deltaproteobacteria bacterium]